MIYKRNTYYDPEIDGEDFSRITSLLLEWRDNVAKHVKSEMINGKQMTVIDDPILVRADKNTEWHYIGKFMQSCTHRDAAFWKLEFALSEVDKEELYLQRQGG